MYKTLVLKVKKLAIMSALNHINNSLKEKFKEFPLLTWPDQLICSIPLADQYFVILICLCKSNPVVSKYVWLEEIRGYHLNYHQLHLSERQHSKCIYYFYQDRQIRTDTSDSYL
jgi:hypothetical protein